MAPVDVPVETIIDRPVEVVSAYAGDPTNAPEWYVNIRSVEWQTPSPVGVGSRMDFVAQFLGRRMAGQQGRAEGLRRGHRSADGEGDAPGDDEGPGPIERDPGKPLSRAQRGVRFLRMPCRPAYATTFLSLSLARANRPAYSVGWRQRNGALPPPAWYS